MPAAAPREWITGSDGHHVAAMHTADPVEGASAKRGRQRGPPWRAIAARARERDRARPAPAPAARSNIFGTNLLDIAFVGVVDLLWPGGPVLNELGRFSVVASVLGIAVTGIYVASLNIRKTPRVLRMGIDSVLVLLVYFGGVALLYRMRGE
jgi:hypothetical protein